MPVNALRSTALRRSGGRRGGREGPRAAGAVAELLGGLVVSSQPVATGLDLGALAEVDPLDRGSLGRPVVELEEVGGVVAEQYPDAALQYLGKPAAELKWGQRVRHPDAMALVTVDDVVRKIDGFFDLESDPGFSA